MISNEVQRELKRRLPGIVDTYGGVTNFITFIREYLNIPTGVREKALSDYSKSSLYQYINTLITYSNDVILISPWNLFLDLRLTLNDGITTNDSVNLEEPYRVYNTKGELLYSVKNHFGAFGESRLDKNLIINSTNASMYFLKFKSYNGREQIKLLLVNMFSKRTEISNKLLRKPNLVETSSISIVNQTGLAVNVYEVESSIIRVGSFPFIQDQYRKVIQPNDVLTSNVEKSKYFFFDPSAEIERTFITNPVNDIVFEIFTNSLIFVGSGIDVSVLNKEFNRGLQFSNKPIQDIITLKPLGL